jgi:hypothetical protein
MGTIIADSSHFTALHRNLMQCQVTVMLAGFLSLIHALQQRVRKCCPDPSLRVCYHLDSGWSVVLPLELLPGEVLADGAPSRSSCGSHCCFPPMINRVRLSPSAGFRKVPVAEAP